MTSTKPVKNSVHNRQTLMNRQFKKHCHEKKCTLKGNSHSTALSGARCNEMGGTLHTSRTLLTNIVEQTSKRSHVWQKVDTESNIFKEIVRVTAFFIPTKYIFYGKEMGKCSQNMLNLSHSNIYSYPLNPFAPNYCNQLYSIKERERQRDGETEKL